MHYVDVDTQRRAIVERSGAICLAMEDVAPMSYDIVFIAHPSKSALEVAFSAVAPAGHITSAAPSIDDSAVILLQFARVAALQAFCFFAHV